MDLSLFTGGAILGAVIGFWNQIKSFLWSIVSILIQKADITTEEAHKLIIQLLHISIRSTSMYQYTTRYSEHKMNLTGQENTVWLRMSNLAKKV